MKTAKRLLALALAGVMALALLTGCSDSKQTEIWQDAAPPL